MSACFLFFFTCIIKSCCDVLNFGKSRFVLPLSAIKTLTGTNYEDWYESLTINLAIMNLDLALRVEAPAALTEKSSAKEKTYYER
jgi:hypothetical protein